jgi:hypothetical protein
MSIFRLYLLPISLVLGLGVTTLAAQSAPEKKPTTIPFADSGQVDSSTGTDLLSLNLNTELNPPSPLDRIVSGDSHPQLSQFSVPRMLLHNQPDLLADSVCLKMRVYKVARDGPNTDSVHAVGYTTCSPAARFQTHSTKGVIPQTTP